MEYWDPARGKGVVFAFRGKTPDEAEHRFVLAGLKPETHYRLHFEDGNAADMELTGRELMDAGLAVHLPEALSSELIFIEEAK
jgi:hypothetical protein